MKVHSKYTATDFDEDIRTVLRRTGCRNEKVCFIMDESNMLDTGFLERLNTLLANGEVILLNLLLNKAGLSEYFFHPFYVNHGSMYLTRFKKDFVRYQVYSKVMIIQRL